MLAHSQDFTTFHSWTINRISCRVWVDPVGEYAGTEGVVKNTSPECIFSCTISPHFALGFTLPCLYGSLPLHSLVTSIQGVEADDLNLTGLCPFRFRTQYSVLSL